MTRGDVLTLLRTEAKRVSKVVGQSIWYLFGSAIETFELAADIDILVLCDSLANVAPVRHELQEICSRLPLHLFLVTRDEEAELDFIATEGCRRIYPVEQ
jgi:hypothetical protein